MILHTYKAGCTVVARFSLAICSEIAHEGTPPQMLASVSPRAEIRMMLQVSVWFAELLWLERVSSTSLKCRCGFCMRTCDQHYRYLQTAGKLGEGSPLAPSYVCSQWATPSFASCL